MSASPLFKTAINSGDVQLGLWLALADAGCAELCAGAGYDWVLIDGEHAPNDVRTVLAQLQTLAAYPCAPVVRVPSPDPVIIKQMLDIGAVNIMVPMVETPYQAEAMARAMRYPPRGVRGVGSGLARASRWSRRVRYLHEADDEVCLVVQVESRKGVANLDAIARIEGVDAVFFGAADLAADMGRLGGTATPEVVEVMLDCLRRTTAAGRPSGVLTSDLALARRYLDAGARFVALGADSALLARAADELAARGRGLLAESAGGAPGG